jgi:oligopeptidase B
MSPVTRANETVVPRLAGYSPCINDRAQNSPPILAAGLTAPRVTYGEPLKWVQKLRATMRGGGPIRLHTQMGAGHAGASGRLEVLEDAALEYAFVIACAARSQREGA